MGDVIVGVKDLRKSFGPTRALDGVSLEFRAGEIHGLIGENGSGKSTLSSIVAGMLRMDSGEMTLDGKPYRPRDMIEARERGVAMIVQERGTIPGIGVAENLFIGEERRFVRRGVVDRARMRREADEALARLGIGRIRASDPVDALDFEGRKLVELARAALRGPRVLIVDETPTALAHEGRRILYAAMSALKAVGGAVVFISHDIQDLMGTCDRLSVLRDGKLVAELAKPAFDASLIKSKMVGREMGERFYREDAGPGAVGDVVLRAEGLVVARAVKGVSLELRSGEILGVGGLAGSGMHELGRALFGIVGASRGSVSAGSSGAPIGSPRDAVRCGVAYVSKDRDQEALCLEASVRDNLVLASLKALAKRFLISPRAEDRLSRSIVEALSVKCGSLDQEVRYLSGGNKQKVSFGKWLAARSEILVLDCPTRGVDIGVKAAMYDLMCSLKAEGKAILLISEELPELIGMSDRVLIMKDGAPSGEFERGPGLTEGALLEAMV